MSQQPSYAAVSDNAPYPGLRPYHESEQDKFFGRDADCKILIDKILVHRLTLLFAATGVGKSSLLQAAVLPQLKAPHGENLDVVYYIDWVSNPLTGLRQAVQQALQDSGSWRPEIVYAPREDEKLADFFSFCTLFVRQPLVVVLDQFEEFFRYQRGHDSFEPFLEQLTGVFSDLKLPVHLVFSMREDFALELNAFKKYVPLSVFSNLYRLEKLGRKAAELAILEPLKPTGFCYEKELLQQLLTDLLSRELSRDANSPLADMTEVVEPPYLQIACLQLWEREQVNPEKTLRLKTYQAAGGAKGLLENYIFNTLQDFSEREKVVTSHALNHLIGQRGTKVAHTVPRLAALIRVPESELDQVLFKLGQKRILRSQPREDVLWYELYHDMFSAGLERWNNRQKEKMRNRRLVQIGSAAAAAILVITFGTIWGVNQFNHHLRLSGLEGSRVEIYHGKKGWPDPFHQQQYAYESNLFSQDMEPDKRFIEQGVFKYTDLNNELTGYRPFAERIHDYIEHGSFSKVLEIKEKAFAGGNPKTSRDIILGLFGLKTQIGFGLVTQSALIDKQSILNDIALSCLQNNTLLFPVDELTFFTFFYSQLKQKNSDFIPMSPLDPRLLKKITSYLTDKNTVVRQTAATALGRIGDPHVVPDLINALQDENEGVRQNAAEALGLIGDPRAIHDLTNSIKDNNESVRRNAAEAIGLIGDSRIITELNNALKNEKENVRQNAALAIGLIGDSRSIPDLFNAIKDKNEGVQQYAVYALGLIGDTRVIPYIRNALKNEKEDVRQDTAFILGRIGDPLTIPDLRTASKDEKEDVRQYAVSAIGFIGGSSAIPDIANAINDESENVRKNAAEALGRIGDPHSITNLTNAINDKNENVRKNAALALGQIGDILAIPYLRNVIKDKNENVRKNAAEAFGLIGDPRVLPELINAIKDENESVRSSAAEALGRIGAPNAIPELTNALKDEDESVRKNAANSLGHIGDPCSISDLTNALKDENESVRSSAAEALGRIGDPRAIPDITNAIKDEEASVRKSAAEAFGLIGESNQILLSETTTKEYRFKWGDFLIGRLDSISGTINDRKALLQAINLPISSERTQQLLTLTQKTDAHLSIRQKAIEILAESKDASLVEPLQPLKFHAQLNKTITELEEKALPPSQIMNDVSRKLSARLAAFKRLAKEDKTTAKQEILRIIQQPEEDAFSNLAYRLLGDLQITDNGVIPLLQQRLDALDEQFRDWRKLRDSKPLSGLTTEEQDEVLEKIREAKNAIKNQQFAFDYAYALSRLDPNIGKQLLTHNLADVRKGAYMGFAMKANIKTLRELDEEREARRDDPIFRHEAFRAIDIGLHRLEILGNNPRDGEKDKELKELRAWQQQLESAAPRTTSDDPDDEVLERLQWTTLMMDHYNKLDKDFREKYGKMRVWPEDALPVNQPYPEQGANP